MRRATTPTHSFTIADIPADSIAKLRITYSQHGQVVLEKTETDIEIENQTISVTLTQDETKLFKRGTVSIQLRILTGDEIALASQIFREDVETVLNDEVL